MPISCYVFWQHLRESLADRNVHYKCKLRGYMFYLPRHACGLLKFKWGQCHLTFQNSCISAVLLKCCTLHVQKILAFSPGLFSYLLLFNNAATFREFKKMIRAGGEGGPKFLC